MEAKPTADMALQHKGLIVGIKTAHYEGRSGPPSSARSRRARSRAFR